MELPRVSFMTPILWKLEGCDERTLPNVMLNIPYKSKVKN